MKLEWIGHSCFRMTLKNGTVIVTDPYDESVGCRMIPLEADIITMSHEHHDHNSETMLKGTPRILKGETLFESDGVKITALHSYHDEVLGAKRGQNYIRVFETEGLKIVHMGDQGCMPAPEILEAILGADILMIPAGGTYTVNAAGAREIIEEVRPACVIPMHVKTKHCGYPIDPVSVFLKEMDAADQKPLAVLDTEAGRIPPGVVLMQPLADSL